MADRGFEIQDLLVSKKASFKYPPIHEMQGSVGSRRGR